MLELRAPEGAVVEHRDVLVADADSDRGTRRRALAANAATIVISASEAGARMCR